jgi:hypothetical protein
MTNERDHARKVFFDAWEKHQSQAPLEPLEAQLIDIILMHPEYHEVLSHPDDYQEANFSDENPFLHLSLHLAIREQVSLDRPAGIKTIYKNLLTKHQDILMAEHQMMNCLALILWDAQQNGKVADEKVYLEKLRQL